MSGRLLLGSALGVGAELASAGLLLTSAWLIVRAGESPPVLYLMVAITSVRMFGVARAALRYAERIVTHDVALGRAVDARVRAYEDVDRIAPGGLGGHRHGALVQQVVVDVDAVQDRLLRIRLPWVTAVAAAIAVVAVAATILPLAGLVVATQFLVVAAGTRVVLPRLAAAQARARSAGADDLAGDVTELVRAAPELAVHGAGAARAVGAHAAIDRVGRADRRLAWVDGFGAAFGLLAAAGATVAVAVLTAAADVDATLTGVLLLAPLTLLDACEPLVEAERRRPGVELAEARLAALRLAPAPVTEPVEAARFPARSDLVVRDLAVGWDGPVARGIDLDLPAGTAAVVTGPSGAGKSTLAATLVRLVEPRDGQVLLGGVDLTSLPAEQVRGTIGWMTQDDVVLDTTLRENLRVGAPSAADDTLTRALDRAGLGPLLAALPVGLDTPLGEGGSTLSGGERRRLALARMLLAGHRVLVLDEPTEHLDAPTAADLLDDVLALCPEHSVLLVSHAPDVVARVDRRIVLHA